MYLVSAEEMRRFDVEAIRDYGIPGVVLMENAGRTSFQILKAHSGGNLADKKVAVITGPGNNGGDGYVIARYLLNDHADVTVFLLSPRDKIKGDALINLQILEKMTDRIVEVRGLDELSEACSLWRDADVIIDAMLGTGLQSEVRSPFRDAIAAVNESRALRLAVDLPSGLNADSGRIMGAAVKADLTVTYGFMKIGMAVHPGLDRCGTIHVADISIPSAAVAKAPPLCTLYSGPVQAPYWKLRENARAHKGTFGHVLVVGGSPGKTGAPAMAAMSASRIGAGLVTVGVPVSLTPVYGKLTEEMTEPLPETCTNCLGAVSIGRVLDLAKGKGCVVLGPGLGAGDGVRDMVEAIVECSGGSREMPGNEAGCNATPAVGVGFSPARFAAPEEREEIDLSPTSPVNAVGAGVPGTLTDWKVCPTGRSLPMQTTQWIVIDADGLNAIASDLSFLKAAGGRVVLTPHPGEMGRLVGKSSREVQEDRIGLARKMATELGVWVVLKGARTLTAFPDGRIVVNPTGNPWMASGGQGDVLSGLLGGLLAQGLGPDEAIPFGVYVHGAAADRIVNRVGPAPVLATDIIREVPAVLSAMHRG